MLICFIGIDGSGKTRYAFKLYQELKTMGFKCSYIHFDSLFAKTPLNILSKIKNLRTTKHINIKDSREGNTSCFKSTFKRTIWPLLIIIDNIFFYLLKLKTENRLVICDRYFYDSAVSCVYSGAKEAFIYGLYQRIFPSPDIMFLMDVEPKIAYNRKHEHSLEYLAYKRELYLRIYSLMQYKKIKVNSSSHFDKSFMIVMNEALESLRRR